MNQSEPRRMLVWHAVLGAVLAVGCGLLLRQMWLHLGLPDEPLPGFMADYAKPSGLGRFVFLAFPLAAWLPTLGLVLLEAFSPAPAQRLQGRRTRLLDAVSYLLLPGLVVITVIWEQLGNAWLALGLCYLGLVTYKGWLLIALLWRGYLDPEVRPRPTLGRGAQAAAWLCAFLILGLSSLWVQQAVSSVGDEVGYTIMTHSLVTHGDIDPGPTVEGKEYQAFYWARFSPRMAFDIERGRTLIFPYVLAPAYALGGRPGLLLFLAAVTALLAVQILAWLEGIGVRAGPAAATAAMVTFCAPVFFLSQQVYPDIIGALAVVVALRLMTALPRHTWAVGLGVLAAAAFLVALKFRLAPVALGLIVTWLYLAVSTRLGTLATLLLGVLGLILVAAVWWFTPLSTWLTGHLAHILAGCKGDYGWWRTAGIFLNGLALDQSFGIISTAPVFLLALAGLPLAFRRFPGAALGVALPLLLLLEAVHQARWCQWYGGFATPGRFLVVMLPACAVFLAPVVSALSRPWWRVLVLLPAVASAAYVWVLTLLPQLRFSGALGINRLVQVLEGRLGFPLYHLLPSAFTYSPLQTAWLVALLGGALILALLAWRRSRPETRPTSPLVPEEGLLTALLLLGLLGIWLVGARLMPPSVLEAEHMASSQAAIYSENVYPDRPRGRSLSNGHAIIGFLHFPGGAAELRLKGYSGAPGQITLSLDGTERGRYTFQGQEDLVMPLGQVSRGFRLIKLSWKSCPERRCFLLVDRLELE